MHLRQRAQRTTRVATNTRFTKNTNDDVKQEEEPAVSEAPDDVESKSSSESESETEDTETSSESDDEESNNQEWAKQSIVEIDGNNSVFRQDNNIFFYGTVNKKNIVALRQFLHQCSFLADEVMSQRRELLSKRKKQIKNVIKGKKRIAKHKSKARRKADTSEGSSTIRRLYRELSSIVKKRNKLDKKIYDARASKTTPEENTLRIFIHSPGGDADLGLLAYDMIIACPLKVHTVVDGLCASAATLLFLAGESRSMAPNGCIMIHQAEMLCTTQGKMDDIQAELQNLKEANNKMIRIYTERSKLNEKQIRKHMRTDQGWSRDEAQSFGFVNSPS